MPSFLHRLRNYRSHFPGGPLSLEWCVLTVLLSALALWLSIPGQMPRANAWLHDIGGASQRHQPAPEVVLVLADDPSMAAIGRWPWRRALHAQVLRHIDAGYPQAIGLDIFFTEADLDYPEDDLLLAQAMAASARVVLPVMHALAPDSPASSALPLPLLAESAARLGHTHLQLDPDGAVRRFYALEGPQQQPWLHWSLGLACIEQPHRPYCDTSTTQSKATGMWEAQALHHINFAQGTQPFTSYSYLDVLSGRIPSSAFRNKLVLIGVTATGVATHHATPGASRTSMASVEISAHLLSGTLQGKHTQAASAWANHLFNLLPVLLAMVGLALLGPSAALVLCSLLVLATLVAMAGAQLWLQRSFDPAAALLLLGSAYPLWSWRRLNAAARFLQHELHDLQGAGLNVAEPDLLPKGDFLQHRLKAVEQASQQLRQLHHFVSDTLLQLPSPTLVCDAKGHVLLANSAAQAYAQSLQRSAAPGASMAALLEGAIERGTLAPLWQWPMPDTAPSTALQREGMDVLQRSLLLISRPFAFEVQQGWLVTLVDISDLRQAVAQRDQAMHFISHDIRAPIGAILTVIEMARNPSKTPSGAAEQAQQHAQLLERIAHYAGNSLALADDFVHLARTQQASSRREPVELGMVLDQALDEAWAAAHQRGVELDWMPQETEAWVLGDASQLRRLCVNLLSNAIKYGPAQGTVYCTLAPEVAHLPDGSTQPGWVLGVRDEGAGISEPEQQRLFTPFTRQHHHEGGPIAGVGLGLAYVHAVATQHGGTISIRSAPGQGAEFRLWLPQHAMADTASATHTRA